MPTLGDIWSVLWDEENYTIYDSISNVKVVATICSVEFYIFTLQ